MNWFTKIINYVKVEKAENKTTANVNSTKNNKEIKLTSNKKEVAPNEIRMGQDISDAQIRTNQIRSNYITVVKNPDYTVRNGDTIETIAQKFGVEVRSMYAANGLNENTAKKIKIGQVLKIPNSRKIKNVKNLNDIAKSMGVSLDFIKKLKKAEDSANLAENKFHNTPYIDNAGVKTIGIGHLMKKGDPQKLTDAQVCELCAKDLLKMEENLICLLGGQKKYDALPQSIKEALLDMTFNKGTAIIEKTPGLLYCLKSEKYEAAINKFTYNKSTKTGKEMSGLNKRRLFDISIATKMYGNNVPRSNVATAQQLYTQGVQLLRLECKEKNLNFQNVLNGYNNDIKNYFGNRMTLNFITK